MEISSEAAAEVSGTLGVRGGVQALVWESASSAAGGVGL